MNRPGGRCRISRPAGRRKRPTNCGSSSTRRSTRSARPENPNTSSKISASPSSRSTEAARSPTTAPAVIDFLAVQGVAAERRAGAPGVYVGDAKIAALGLKIKNGCSYHGLALNVDMDLSPFAAINPCGYAGLKVIQTKGLDIPLTAHEAGEQLSQQLLQQLDQQHG
jgi:hypothetical protein